MQAYPCHELFNDLNNLRPVLVIDFRDEASFDRSHLRGALRVPIPFQPTAALLTQMEGAILQQPAYPCTTFLVLALRLEDLPVVPDVSKLFQTNSDGLCVPVLPTPCPAVWAHVQELRYFCYDCFEPRYRSCPEIVVSSDRERRATPTQQTYAAEVLPGFLFLGDFYNASDTAQLQALGITHVIDASNDRLSEAAARKLGLAYLPVDVWDMETVSIAGFFEQTNAFIDSAMGGGGGSSAELASSGGRREGRVLVHCRAGISRSSTLVLAYLLYSLSQPLAKEGPDPVVVPEVLPRPCSLKQAVLYLLRQRPVVCPNEGFRAQLRDYEEKLLGSGSFSSDAEFLEVLRSLNILWTRALPLNTAYDRMPITAVSEKQRQAMQGLTEFPEESQPIVTEDPCSSGPKPKKPFLKR
eukprot:RCo002885